MARQKISATTHTNRYVRESGASPKTIGGREGRGCARRVGFGSRVHFPPSSALLPAVLGPRSSPPLRPMDIFSMIADFDRATLTATERKRFATGASPIASRTPSVASSPGHPALPPLLSRVVAASQRSLRRFAARPSPARCVLHGSSSWSSSSSLSPSS